MMFDLTHFTWLTFDCYGTLIDWEIGILTALRPILGHHGQSLGDEEVLELFGRLEQQQEAGAYLPYREVLENVVGELGHHLGFEPTHDEVHALPLSLPSWPPFPDTVPALRRLKSVYKLAVISNTDDDLFAETGRRLEVPFDAVITAQQARSYKPSHRNFELALERLGVASDRVLHVAQSLYHDHVPARELGIYSVWINRRAGKQGGGATVPADIKPRFEFPDLRTFADFVGV